MTSLIKHGSRLGWALHDLRDEFERVFRDLEGPFDANGRTWSPPIDIVDKDDKLVLTAELPGMQKGDIKIDLQDNVLTIEGEKHYKNEEKKASYYHCERAYGKFSRSFTLPRKVDSAGIMAEFKDGVLTITMPKTEDAKPRQIEIK